MFGFTACTDSSITITLSVDVSIARSILNTPGHRVDELILE